MTSGNLPLLSQKISSSLGRNPSTIGGPAPKMPFFQMVPKPFLSILIYFIRCEYDTLKISLKKNDQNLPVGRVKHDNRVPGGNSFGFGGSLGRM